MKRWPFKQPAKFDGPTVAVGNPGAAKVPPLPPHWMMPLNGLPVPGSSAPALPVTFPDASIIGEVKKIDESSGSIMLKQGPAPSLGFKEDMTMVYDVRDRAMLKQVKVGDTVKFEAESGDSGFTITKMQKAK